MNFKKTICLLACAVMPLWGNRDYSKELIMAYFPEPFVNETLPKYNVPKEEWEAINKELAAKERELIPIVEEKAAKISPTLLVDAKQKQAAVKLFRETLLQLFSEVMMAHGITDNAKIQEMLDSIQQLKAERFLHCMQNKKNEKSDELEG
jgi:hypothetical protein